jgi:hypothetical protein
LTAVDLNDEGPPNDALHKRPKGNKASKADLKRDVSALAFGETLKNLMAEKEALAKTDEKRR